MLADRTVVVSACVAGTAWLVFAVALGLEGAGVSFRSPGLLHAGITGYVVALAAMSAAPSRSAGEIAGAVALSLVFPELALAAVEHGARIDRMAIELAMVCAAALPLTLDGILRREEVPEGSLRLSVRRPRPVVPIWAERAAPTPLRALGSSRTALIENKAPKGSEGERE